MLISTGLVNTISVCRSASEAVQFLKNTNDDKSIPDMIFLDLNMPGMNGWEFLECYQAILPKMNTAPLLYVVSSSIADDDYERAMNIHGVNGYMSKPLQPLQLKTLMHSIYL
jgi:CheY-like chemotaxis protein